ncbi:hypothetical protein AB7M49_005079 [Bradyrhizobium elkanii]
MSIGPADVRLRLLAGLTGRLQRQHRTCALERECLRYKIILAADPAHDLAILQTIRDRSAEQRRHHRVVDEARIDPGATLAVLVAEDLVGEGNRHHLDSRQLLRCHLAQRPVE